MTNVLISLILGLWLLVAVAFYAFIVGTALCRIVAGLRHGLGALTRSGDLRRQFLTGGKRLNSPSHPLRMKTGMALVVILVLPAAGFAWTASSLIRYCDLVLLVILSSAWVLVMHSKE